MISDHPEQRTSGGGALERLRAALLAARSLGLWLVAREEIPQAPERAQPGHRGAVSGEAMVAWLASAETLPPAPVPEAAAHPSVLRWLLAAERLPEAGPGAPRHRTGGFLRELLAREQLPGAASSGTARAHRSAVRELLAWEPVPSPDEVSTEIHSGRRSPADDIRSPELADRDQRARSDKE